MQSELLSLVPEDLRGSCAAYVLKCYREAAGPTHSDDVERYDCFVDALLHSDRRGVSAYAICTAWAELQEPDGNAVTYDLFVWAAWRAALPPDEEEAIKQAGRATSLNVSDAERGRRKAAKGLRAEIFTKMRLAVGLSWVEAQYVAHAFIGPWIRTGQMPAYVPMGLDSYVPKSILNLPTPPRKPYVRPERSAQLPAPAPPKPTVELESPIEEAFWAAHNRLRLPQLRDMVPQHPILHYRVDFAVPELRIAVELDGHAYHSSKEDKARDTRRQRDLLLAGWQVIRFTGSEVHKNVDACVRDVASLAAAVAR